MTFVHLILIAVAVVLLIAGVKYYRRVKEKKSWKDITLPMPEKLRTDIIYGYYSALDGNWARIKDHVNMFFYTWFSHESELIDIMRNTTVSIVVDMAPFVNFRVNPTDKKIICHPDAAKNLREFFTKLRNEGVLHRLTHIVVNDEPNLFVQSAEEHLKQIQAVKRVTAEFPELSNSRLICIYGRGQPFWNIGEFDTVGVDDYDQKSMSLTRGEHARLMKEVQSHQRTMLVPGPAFGHDPQPWVAYAHSHPEVEMVASFLWFDHPDYKDVDFTGLEARPKEFQDKWIAAAHEFMQK